MNNISEQVSNNKNILPIHLVIWLIQLVEIIWTLKNDSQILTFKFIDQFFFFLAKRAVWIGIMGWDCEWE